MAFNGIFPVSLPEAPRFGLLSADGVTVENHARGDESWTQGPYDWENLVCAFDTLLSDMCTNESDGVIGEAESVRSYVGYPFGIVAKYECTTQGLTLDERERRVRAMAAAITQKSVEYELATGAISLANGHLDVRYLSSADALDITPGGTAVSPHVAVAALEWGLGQFGVGEGVLHLTKDVTFMVADRLDSDREHGKIWTKLGTPVVAGSGYPGEEPASSAPLAPVPVPSPDTITAAPETQWIYATGPVHVHLGAVDYIGERVNSADNVITALAGRPAAVHWDGCCHIAVQVDLSA